MSKHRVEFRLTMPNVGSWDGRWSGADRNYLYYATLTSSELDIAGFDDEGRGSWHYSWGDGWGATVRGRVMSKGERRKRSDGFCGYEWMIANIRSHGSARHWCELPGNDHDMRSASGGWEQCRHCSLSRRIAAESGATP